jgi:hypothetical protein
LFLVKRNVPFDIAFSLPDEERLAWIIILGEQEGRKFDFNTMRWTHRR